MEHNISFINVFWRGLFSISARVALQIKTLKNFAVRNLQTHDVKDIIFGVSINKWNEKGCTGGILGRENRRQYALFLGSYGFFW